MIFVNFKTYEQGSGRKAIALTRVLEEVVQETLIKVIPVVQVIDAEIIIESTKLDVWVQHVDPISYGAHTGWTLPEEAVRVGIKGVFLNHSEHKFEDWDYLAKAVSRCKEVGLSTLVFSGDIDELKKVIDLRPDFVSYEPPELVGSTETSVSESKPEVIHEAAEVAKEAKIPLIVGAGVKTTKDIEVALDLGADGFAIASSIVKSEDPKKELLELIKGYHS